MIVANALLVVSEPAVMRTRASSASLCVSISSFGSLSSDSVKRLICVRLFAESTFVSLWAIWISRHVSKHLYIIDQYWRFNSWKRSCTSLNSKKIFMSGLDQARILGGISLMTELKSFRIWSVSKPPLITLMKS